MRPTGGNPKRIGTGCRIIAASRRASEAPAPIGCDVIFESMVLRNTHPLRSRHKVVL